MSPIPQIEIDYMAASIDLFPVISREPIWLRAFAFYNENNSQNKLSVTCKPCYMKVYLFCKNYDK